MSRRIMLAAALLVALAAPSFAQTCDTRFTLINQSRVTINEFYFSPSSSGAWGDDRFGNGVLPGGRRLEMDTRIPGLHDFRAVPASGAPLELRNVDICRIERVIITQAGTLLAE